MEIRGLLRQHGPTLLASTLAGWLTSHEYFGFVWFLLGPAVIIWLLAHLFSRP